MEWPASDPLVTGLTADEWARYWRYDPQGKATPKVDVPAGPDTTAADRAVTDEARKTAFGAPSIGPA